MSAPIDRVLELLQRSAVCVDCISVQTELEGHVVVEALKRIAKSKSRRLGSAAAECAICQRLAPVFRVV